MSIPCQLCGDSRDRHGVLPRLLAMTCPLSLRGAMATKQSRESPHTSSLRLEIDRLDELPILLVVALQRLRELFGTLGYDGHADRLDLLLHVRQHHRAVDLAVEQIDDVLRRARGGEKAEPAARIIAGHRFGDGRGVRPLLLA